MSHNHDAIDELPPPLPLPEAPPAVAAAPTAFVAHGADQNAVLLQLHQQTDLLQKLHKTVLTSRSMINELVVSNNELKQEIQKIKHAAQCENCRKKDSATATTYAAQGLLSVAVAGGDSY